MMPVSKETIDSLQQSVDQTSEALDNYAQKLPKQSDELKEHISAMAKTVGGLSAKINAASRVGEKNYFIPDVKNPLLSAAFLVPVLVLMVVVTVSIWLFSLAGLLGSDLIYIITLGVGLLLVMQVLVSNVRNLQLRRRIARQSGTAINEELQLEHSRAEFFRTATDELQGHLFAITSAIPRGSDPAIDDAAQRLLTLLDRMALISTLTNRGADYVLNTEPVDMPTMLSQIISRSHAKAQKARVQVRLDAPRQLVYELDPLLLKQAIAPVLDNAIKFSKDAQAGGRVLVALKPTPRGFELKIADNGPGISVERRPQLFKPFSRGEDALRFNYEGAGLGLYLTSLATGLLGANVEIGNPKLGTEIIWKFDSLVPTSSEQPKAKSTQKPAHNKLSAAVH